MMEDWKQRTRLLLGEEKMERLQQAHVLVVGLGGVGAYAAEMICRAGVGRDDCGRGHGAAYQYKSSAACFTLYYG